MQLPNPKGVVDVFGHIHASVARRSVEFREELRRHNYVTPTSYLELLGVFKFLLQEKRNEVGGLRSKLQFGVDTLTQAAITINELQEDLQEKKPRLIDTQQKVVETLAEIEADRADAEVTKTAIEAQEQVHAVG